MAARPLTHMYTKFNLNLSHTYQLNTTTYTSLHKSHTWDTFHFIETPLTQTPLTILCTSTFYKTLSHKLYEHPKVYCYARSNQVGLEELATEILPSLWKGGFAKHT